MYVGMYKFPIQIFFTAVENDESVDVTGEASSSNSAAQAASSLPKFVPLGTPLPPSQPR